MLKKLILKNRIFQILLVALLISAPAYAISPVISWMMDMVDQISIKPQGEGTMTQFPVGSVTTDGILVSTDGYTNPEASSGLWMMYRNDSSLAPANPVASSEESLKNGEYLYNVYCTVCHGEDGNAQTPVGMLRGAPPLTAIIGGDPTFAQGYLYSKIKYGGLVPESMPPFGYATSAKERWDIVNYVFKKWSPAASN